MKLKESDRARLAGSDEDEALDAAARGVAPTSDDAALFADADEEKSSDETDLMGDASGVPDPDHRPLADSDQIARRDAHRWENNPASAEDAGERNPGSKKASN